MSDVKRFLIIFVVAYLIFATSINMIFGPPGMSKEYMDEFKADQNRYIEAVKNKEFKEWKQRPHLVDVDAEGNAGLRGRIVFVGAYETRELFQSEMRRRGIYDLIFDFFNTIMVIVLVGWFARKPLAGVIDGMIERIRDKIVTAEVAKEEAEERLDAAEQKIKGLIEDQAGYEKLVEERIENIRRDSALFTGQSMSILNDETADRKRFELVKARQRLKEQLVDAAIAQVQASIVQTIATGGEDELIDRFMADLREDST